MPIHKFPDPRRTTEEGIVALGGDLHPDSLLLAYRQGIFPWPVEGLPLAWFCPEKRGILEFSEIHIPRSLAKERRRCEFRYTFNRAFADVIELCAEVPRPGQDGTWITPFMIDAYIEFHHQGYAHSIEVWEDETLVGGLYGVAVDGCFAGESMFHSRPNASKLAILHLVDHLKARGCTWIDIQMITPHMTALGAREISRDAFLEKLARSRDPKRSLF